MSKVSPRTEMCDGKDDDCDGSKDEGPPSCGGGKTCVQGTCVACTSGQTRDCGGSGVCKVGKERCVNNEWSGTCDGALTCKRTEDCRSSACVAKPLPEGSYSRSCNTANCTYDGTTLICECGGSTSSVNASSCREDIANCPGGLKCLAFYNGQQSWPGGSWTDSCDLSSCVADTCGNRLTCRCLTGAEPPAYDTSSVPLDCASAYNMNGTLRCS